MQTEYDIPYLSALNLGGGFAALYTNADHPIPLQDVCHTILDTCKKENAETTIKHRKNYD